MSATILDGRALSRRLNRALKERVGSLPRPPGLAVILVGEDPGSKVYVARKGVVAERLGFVHRQVDLPADSDMDQILGHVRDLNNDNDIDGVLVQLPLPGGLDGRIATEAIDPSKDVDGLTTVNAGCLFQGRPNLVPCTPQGVMHLLEEGGVDLSGKDVAVIGRSNLFGRPMACLLEHANATVTLCHSRTQRMSEIVGRSDVVVAAIGRPGHVRGEWIRDGAVVIDVGVNRLADGSLAGDVEFEEAVLRASAITPVPGGVGPMTIAMLMANTFLAATRHQVD